MPKTPTHAEIVLGPQVGLRAWLRTLNDEEPKRAPKGVLRRTLSSEMSRMGHELGCRFRSRSINGVVWVTREPRDA